MRSMIATLLLSQGVPMLLSGDEIAGDTLLLLFHAGHAKPVDFTLPTLEEELPWQLVTDTSDLQAPACTFDPGGIYPLQPISVVVLRQAPPKTIALDEAIGSISPI